MALIFMTEPKTESTVQIPEAKRDWKWITVLWHHYGYANYPIEIIIHCIPSDD